MSYLDSLPEFNNKAILVQSTLGYQMAMAYLGYRDVGLENLESGSYLLGDFEDNNGPFNNVQLASPNESLFDSLSDEITWYNQLLGVANDTNQSEDTRLKCLTELVDQARLNEVPLLPYNPVITPQTNIPPSALVIHNETTGVEGVGFLHIGPVELALIYSARQSFDSFAQITGVYTDNASLVGGFATKEDLITPSGNVAQFWNGNKAFAAVAFNQLASTPTTLAGYGISASDNLFDNKYLQLGSQLQTLNTTSGTPLTTTTTVIEGFGRLQNQVSARELSLGNPAVNGYVLSSTTAGVRSWIPAPTGTAVTGISLTGTNGITGAVVITAGNAVITAGTNITGMLKGNGTSISAATEMTDYIGITGATNGDTILFTGGVATWAPGLSNPMTLLGDLIIGGASGATTRLAGNTTTTRKFLMSVGASGAALAQTYESLLAGDIPNIAISQVTNLQNTLDGYLPDALANGMLFIGNVSDVAVNAIVTGDLTATYVDNSGTNEAEFTIANEAVTYAKIQNVTSQTLLGRFALTDGVAQQLTLNGSDFTINSSTGVIGLVTPNSPILTTKGDILTHTGAAQARLGIGANATFFMADTAATTGNKWVAMSGDATIATSGALTIAAGAVTLAKMANMATNSFIGRISASTGVPEILTATQATSLLNLFSSSAKGLAPVVTGAAIGDATYFLNATGTWSVPAGGGGGSGTVTSANQYSIPYYSVSPSGTTVIGLAPQTTNGVYFLRANVTASAAVAPDWIGSTGSGNVVLATSPTLVTPTLGVATATSINKVAITAPATSATLTIADGSTFATSGAFSTTLTATATTTLTLPTTGTLATLSGTETFANKTLNGPKIGTAAGSGHFHMHYANSVPTGLADYITVFGDTSPNKKLGFLFELDGFESYFQFEATTTSKTYTFPDLSGTVALLANAAAFTSVTVGTASSLAGDVIFQNATNATTQTFRGTNPTSSIVYLLPTTAPTAGQVLSSSAPSAGVATLSWATVASGSTALSAITAAAAGNTIANADFAQVWNWATLAANTALTLGSVGVTSGTILSVTHSTSALTGNLVNIASTANITTGRLLNISSAGTTMTGTAHAGAFISLTGASAAASVTTTGIDVTNTRTGTTSVNIGGRFTATGGTTNYPLISVNNVAGTSGLHDLAALVGRQAAANDAASVSFYSNSLSSANRVVSLKSLFSNPGYNFVLDLFGNTAITEALRIVGTLDAMNMGFGTNAPTAKFHLKHTGTGASLGNISQGMMLLESVSQTNIAIGSEVNGVNFNFTATKGFAATAGTRVTTNQREFLVSAPTYNATTSAYVITNAATMAITAAPTASTNMTFTNTAMALWVQAGLVRFDGDLIVGASAVTPSARLQVRGASGANTAFLVQVNNTTTKVIEAGSTGGGAATLGLYGVTPIVRPTDANQGAITDSTGGTASFTLVDVGAVPTQANINDNFASINRQLAAIRTGLVNLGAITGS